MIARRSFFRRAAQALLALPALRFLGGSTAQARTVRTREFRTWYSTTFDLNKAQSDPKTTMVAISREVSRMLGEALLEGATSASFVWYSPVGIENPNGLLGKLVLRAERTVDREVADLPKVYGA